MPTLSMHVESRLLEQVRVAAQRDGTTVNAIVRDLLTRYTDSRLRSLQHDLRQPERASWASTASHAGGAS